MKPTRRWLIVLAVANGILALLVASMLQPTQVDGWARGDMGVLDLVLADPAVGPGPWSRVNATLIPTEELPRLVVSQPVVYGNLSPSGRYVRVELQGNRSALLVIYDAGSDRVLRVFNLFEGRLE